ncbi:hypothetical protein [Aliikangiella maris]|uniref:Uncharacterized protein n=2 Tax=Aliikangiella maris TaxID=3162458 RepID=A0ABV3MJ03_9GAMM
MSMLNSAAIKKHFIQMAKTPKSQLKRLLIGTICSFVCLILLILSSDWEIQWLFYLLSTALLIAILYAIPGYIGLWMWRMRKFLFDLD